MIQKEADKRWSAAQILDCPTFGFVRPQIEPLSIVEDVSVSPPKTRKRENHDEDEEGEEDSRPK